MTILTNIPHIRIPNVLFFQTFLEYLREKPLLKILILGTLKKKQLEFDLIKFVVLRLIISGVNFSNFDLLDEKWIILIK